MGQTKQLLIEGLSDAVGFVGGALAGYWLARVVGFDAFTPGYSTESIVGIVAITVGSGAGLRLARRWRSTQSRSD